MVAFYSILMAGLLSTMAVAAPAPEGPKEFPNEIKDISLKARDADSGALEARQAGAVRCLAVVGLGPPGTPTRCGSINFLPNRGTGFNPQDQRFPNCNIVTEINFPNCDQYRVTSVTNCGGERQIDIRNPSRGCA
ncbi:hypothetical protein CAC42_42 [Sphaceloma murrayae]|uniref:Uncharacterized protein n=1 Tax=Sphaceloma murrayae TaxID=2082308 RepID=A0A2K1QRZ9_9PEZI|nr:hypothetical protein CAC42_42 [Sphaceloma murrayae]